MSATPPRVLIVDDEEPMRNGLASMVSSWGYLVQTAVDGQDALDQMGAARPDVVVTDLMMPRMDGFELLKRLSDSGAAMPVIVLTAFGNIETAIATIHELNAFWFLDKPIQPTALRVLLDRAVWQARLAQEKELLERQLAYTGTLGGMAGQSAAMQKVFAALQQVARARGTVLITGETGAGKELAARSIHHLSGRSLAPFVPVNCAALPETLAESEIFGHEKGAFSGAFERRAGCFELAQGGTLFLDGITELPLATQAKLLRVLEDGRVRRLGGKLERPIDVRVVASCSQPPEEAVRSGVLREDLYYRLAVLQIDLPPLRERLDDIPVLIEAMLGEINRASGTRVTGVDPAVLEQFASYSWPGNVRELRNVLQRAAVVRGEGVIVSDDAKLTAMSSSVPPHHSGAAAERVLVPVGTTVSEAERALIERTLRHTRNNKTRAAEILGISLKTLFNKLKEYGAGGQEQPAGPEESAKDARKVFVAMPFGEEFDPVFEDHISKVVEAVGMKADRADAFSAPGAIIDDILAAITTSEIVIADCTRRNPNVFYEIGIAHTLGKPTILVTANMNEVPFDLQHLRIIEYQYTPRAMKQFEEKLESAIRSILR
jgi:DNA-binding NtrC family response regulator